MKNITYFLILFLFFSCEPSSILDRPFKYETYEKTDYVNLVKSKELSNSELLLLNYTVFRQRDYFNYSIEGKTFREILALANDFKTNGFPANIKLEDNGAHDQIQQTISMEGVSQVRKPGSKKRRLKTLNFSCKYENPGDKDIVLLNSSFIINGLLKDHITTVNYDINCIIQAGTSTTVNFIVFGSTIRQNLKYEGNPFLQRTLIDDLIPELQAIPSGMTFKNEGKYFKDCFFNAARVQPVVTMDYADALKGKEWKTLGADGKTFELDLGYMHTPADSNQIILNR